MTKDMDRTAQTATQRERAEQNPAQIVNEAPLFRVSSHVSDKVTLQRAERINERELLSIYALLAYVSHNQNIRQETVQMIVEAEFGVDHVSKIKRDDYQRVVTFLVDLNLEDKIH